MASRFDYIRYDEVSADKQEKIKQAAIALEQAIMDCEMHPAQQTKALNHLEISYMWVGKGIRDEQIHRNGSAELQEARTDS